MKNFFKKIKCKIIVSKRRLVNKIKTYFLIKKLLNKNNKIKLELGATAKRDVMRDWITVDLNMGSDLCLNLSKSLPFPDNSVDMIYSSHLLEHFSYPEPLTNLLNECRRILKPEGIFSACVPNARIYAEIYLNQKKDSNIFLQHLSEIDFNSHIDYLNHMAYMKGEHKYMFDEENLPVILKKSGFDNVKLRSFNPALHKRKKYRFYCFSR